MTARTIAGVLSLALISLTPACARTSTDTSEPAPPKPRAEAERGPVAPPPPIDASQVELSDSQVGAVILAVHAGEVEQATVGYKRGRSRPVQDFAARLVRDHNDGAQRTKMMMRVLKLRADENELSRYLRLRAQAMAETLRRTEHDFDRTYLQIEIDAQTAALAMVAQAMARARRPELEAELLLVRAALELHVQEAKDLQAKLAAVALR